MDLKDAASLVHFRELHFLPRVIFAPGGIFLIGSFFVRNFILGLFGVGVILAACTLNLFLNVIRAYDLATPFKIPWALLFQFVIALALAYEILNVSYHLYHYGEMPLRLKASERQIAPGK